MNTQPLSTCWLTHQLMLLEWWCSKEFSNWGDSSILADMASLKTLSRFSLEEGWHHADAAYRKMNCNSGGRHHFRNQRSQPGCRKMLANRLYRRQQPVSPQREPRLPVGLICHGFSLPSLRYDRLLKSSD